jgi:SAM-dependent methyltransferase
MNLPAVPFLDRLLRRRTRGRFQPYTHTLPDRYPWLFRFAAEAVPDGPDTRLLSFGCSKGDEVFALRKYFPQAAIKGLDIDRRNIARCRVRARQDERIAFAVASSTSGEATESYDAIFCLAVLCHGDLTTFHAERSEPFICFADFDAVVTDFARCLKPGGTLFLHTTNFRFCDSTAAGDFAVILQAAPHQMAPDVHFGRDNRRVSDSYRAVGFRKRNVPEGQRDVRL